ncbi:hypothetical protein WBQ88_12155 [Sphingopyxis sp. CCNWLW253]|uniref:hypothetical protein n=1 Tax=unclassified Sphingopyxis TaxID=2614943 RepID=UPI00301B0C0A
MRLRSSNGASLTEPAARVVCSGSCARAASQRSLEIFDRSHIVASRSAGRHREDRVDATPQQIVALALFGNTSALSNGKFGANRVLDPVQPIGAQDAGVQELFAKLYQSHCGRMRSKTDQIEGVVTLARRGITPSMCRHQLLLFSSCPGFIYLFG